ncbi:MAG: hypothetical protein QOH52_2881 [Pseudonocardiales bacterium]|jgi:hypothetical protein|nr:hypothetical protein [Jatrophihabitans sp.]MDT4904865.1 hypothetical protein [Pseudonocardiales bacterium]
MRTGPGSSATPGDASRAPITRPPPDPEADDGSLDEPGVEPDVHLVETHGRWRLTLTERLRQALMEWPGLVSAETGAPEFTVLVEPNLVPGERFTATVEVRHSDS